MRRSIAVLKMPRRIGDIITFARSVAVALTDNPDIAAPALPIATLEADIADFEAAHALTLSRTKGLAEARDAKLAVVRTDLEALCSDVQRAADASVEDAAGIIERAGLHVKRWTARSRAQLAVLPGRTSGSARLLAKSAGDRASYEWQYS